MAELLDARQALRQIATGEPLANVAQGMGWPADDQEKLIKMLRRAASCEMHPSNQSGDKEIARNALKRL